MVEIQSYEAEDKILGYLFNPFIELEKKNHVLQLLTTEYFTSRTHSIIFELIKKYSIFDKLVLYDKAQKSLALLQVEWRDFELIDEVVTQQEAESYIEILTDKYQRRRIYDFGKSLQEQMVDGTDPYDAALRAQSILMSIGGRVQLETNEELLDRVLKEEARNVIKTGFKAIDNFIGGYARGMLVTIAGDSGHLKTTLALDKAFRMVEANPQARIAIFSKEMLATDLMKKQIARICGIPTSKIFSQDYDKEYVRDKMMSIDAFRENRIRIINPDIFSGVNDIARIQMTHRFDIWF